LTPIITSVTLTFKGVWDMVKKSRKKMKTSTKSTHPKVLKPFLRFSKSQLLLYASMFGIIGVYLLWLAFAAGPTTYTINSTIVGGSTISSSVSWTVNVSPQPKEVGFYIDGVKDPRVENQPPFTYGGDGSTLDTTKLTNGNHTFMETAIYDNASLSNTYTVTVENITPTPSPTPPPTPPPSPADTTAPLVPTNLRSTSTSSTSISLAWNASTDSGGSGLAGYRLYRNGSLITSTDLLNYTDSNLTPATAYAYKIAAYDNSGNSSSQSSTVNVSTKSDIPPPSPPPAPTPSPAPSPSPVPSTKVKGDINKDGKVNIFDLSAFLTNYNSSAAGSDFNGDGKVNLIDLSILLSNYGK